MTITYAKAGGPPSNWYDLMVVDCETGNEVTLVTEVDTVEGWIVRAVRDERGRLSLTVDGKELLTERLNGNFRIGIRVD